MHLFPSNVKRENAGLIFLEFKFLEHLKKNIFRVFHAFSRTFSRISFNETSRGAQLLLPVGVKILYTEFFGEPPNYTSKQGALLEY